LSRRFRGQDQRFVFCDMMLIFCLHFAPRQMLPMGVRTGRIREKERPSR
jgi:hypothetical protein